MLKIHRRRLLLASGALTGSMMSTSWIGAYAQTAVSEILTPIPGLLPGMDDDEPETASPDLDPTKLGTQTPPTEQQQEAALILAGVPRRVRPYDVALYFLSVAKGQAKDANGNTRPDWAPYARGWPRIYNPVIVEFFHHMGISVLSRNQSGDETHWCAAFVNFCIAASQAQAGQNPSVARQQGTRSASSGSFRCFGTEVYSGPASDGGKSDKSAPKRGDIIVWALDGTVHGCEFGQGHVAFFEEFLPDGRIQILGGNQTPPRNMQNVPGEGPRSGAITLARKPEREATTRDGRPRVSLLHSIRTSAILNP
jgi:hypothetical protein